MTPGSRARRSPRRSPRSNPTPNPAGEPDELAGAAQGPAEGPAESASTAGSEGATVPSHAGTTAPSRAPTPLSTDELFKQFMQAYLESVKNPGQNQAEPREKPLKARSPAIYSGKSHMDCYHFCQQCEDHFDIARATGPKRTPFATSFLRGPIGYRWTQYKRQHQGEGSVPVTWAEFKAFLRKNLGDSRSFVDNIWSKFKRDSQYPLEEARDWASHLEHLQSILIEFDTDGAPEESDLIRFFREGLKPSIKAQMDQRGRELDSWEEIVEKAVEAEAKAGLQPTSYIREIDNRCPRGNRPAHATATKVQTQGSSTKDPRPEEPKSRPQESKSSNPQRSESAETSEKARKEKKKKWQTEKKEKKDKDTAPATGVNTTDTGAIDEVLSEGEGLSYFELLGQVLDDDTMT